MGFSFFFDNTCMGIGLAMDAFSVSLSNGLNEPHMKKRRVIGIAGIFALFQFIMPLIGWLFVSTLTQCFEAFEPYIPWIALALLSYIGGKMLYDSIKNRNNGTEAPAVGIGGLILQGIATSIDALSVGTTISSYAWHEAILACLLIGAITFFICLAGVLIGKKSGTKLAGKAGILGGCILIAIGLKIFIESWF